MKYTTLKKIYYYDKKEYEHVYNDRYSNGIHLDIDIHGNPAFFVEEVEIYKMISKIYKINGELVHLMDSLPPIAKNKYTNKCLIDEIILTNDIEGVRSTRKEIGEILTDLGKRNRKNRFYGLVREYAALQVEENLDISDCQSIRAIYDDLFLQEVKSEDPDDIPDGEIFRAGPVTIVKATQKEIHKGIEPEEKIVDYMEKSLKILSDDSIDIFIRTSIFHYLFGYIHPFYEANGRMSRFISSYILSKNLVYLIGYRLSYYLKEHIAEYYRAFEECNDPKNKGDVTPFVEMFVSVILGACIQLKDELNVLNDQFNSCIELIPKLSEDKKIQDLLFYLVQAALFSDIGISIPELLELTNVTRATLTKRLNEIDKKQLLIMQKRGTNKYYMADLDKFLL